MLRPAKMRKVRAVCLQAVAPSAIRCLHNLSVLHIKDSEIPGIARAGPLPSYDDISSRLVKLRAVREALLKSGPLPKKKVEMENPLDSADEFLAESERLFPLIREREELQKQLDATVSLKKSLSELAGLEVNFSELQKHSILQFLLFKSNAAKSAAAKMALGKRKNSAFTQATAPDGSQIFLAALPKSEDSKFLEQYGSQLPLPQISSSPKKEIEALAAREGQQGEKLLALQKRISRLSDSLYPRLVALFEALEIELDRAEISTKFSATASLYYIEGWVEDSRYEHLKSELHRRFGKKLHLSCATAEHHESPPTKLSNPKAASPFQFIVEFLSTTRYDEIDPSLILAFTIPVIYALIFGDAGYALASLFLSLFMLKKSKPGSLLNQIATIWAISAIPAFFAGVLFDEYFGFTHTHLLELAGAGHVVLYHGLHRVSEITTLMLITILLGMAHLALGFILGAINEWEHSRKHAIAKLCWLGIEIAGFFAVAGFMFNAYPELYIPSVALLALCVAGLVATEGPIAAFEIPGLASNIMSYIRIAAVGVGGVILAEAVNELLFPRLDFSPMGMLLFAVISVLFVGAHLSCCVLAMFESFIHGARLNVVEFFGKFYKGNGIRFAPFSALRLYSKEA